ncbi:DUF3971 domain-containing protein [Puniceibacterium sediminis]|uniref:AsmA-like C-terminal region n=1 Tax=Puniceibacterium sediminis TaxID=1608407 RepID=A0A238W4U9_9RHOB|nr:DUF3971 domain-containing protein [Puniceibacterium sediminis]SNR41566.1 AsmA-like C-terminal region [Puniceibacterium sediminis]
MGRRRKAGLWLLLSLTFFTATAAVAIWAAIGRPLTAPDWLHNRIEARLAMAVPDLQIRFGTVGMLVQRNGLAQVILSDVRVATATGVPIVELSQVSAGFRPGALLQRKIEMREARVSGVFVTLRRDLQGRLGLALGPAFQQSDGGMPDLPTLIGQVDDALMRPMLAGLRSVEVDALTVRLDDERAHRGWTADGGRLQLVRDGGRVRMTAGLAVLGRGDTAATLEVNAASDIGRRDLSFGLNLSDLHSEDIAVQSPALAWLRALQAPISGALRGSMGADGALGELNATLQIGAGALQPNTRTKPIPFSGARTYFSYEPETATLSFNEISVDSEVGQVTADGTAVIQGLDTGWPSAMLGQFTLSRLVANPGNLFADPVHVARAETDFRLELEPFRLSVGRLRVEATQEPIYLRGSLAAGEEGWNLSLDGQLAQTNPQEVAEYWPPVLAPKARKWFLEHVKSGQVSDAQFALRSERGEKPSLYLDFAFDEATSLFARTLPPVTGGSGQFTLINHRLSVMLEQGTITPPEGGPVDVSGTSFAIADTRIKPSQGRVEVKAQGAVTAALSFLDQEPLKVMRRVGKPVTLADGMADVTGFLELPLRKGVRLPDMDFDFHGKLSDVSSDDVVPGRSVSAQALDVSVQPDQLRIAGRARVDGVPFDGSWTQPLGVPGATSTVAGTVTLSADAARTFGVALPEGMLSGQGPGTLDMQLARGKAPEFRLTSKLSGLGLALPAIGWQLSQRGTGSFEVAGTLGDVPRVDRLALDAPGLRTEGQVVLNADRSLNRIALSRVRAGGWLDAPVTLTARGRNATPAITVSGGRVDLRSLPARMGGGGAGGSGGPITVSFDKVIVTSGIELTGIKGDFTTQGGFQGDFTAMAGKKAPISGQIRPQAGGSAVVITAPNAGQVLAGTGLLKTVKGGAMTLRLTPVPGAAGSYDGLLDIREVRLQNAPVIGSILDAISIVGLLDQLNGVGIYFTGVNADFRLTPQQLILRSSSAAGPSMGISLDGYYNLATKALDMQGVVSPIYILNGIGALLTRRGEGLIGFNFNITGTTTVPRVAVNPLSVFTPGMFRELFRRAPPEPGKVRATQ